MNNKGNFDCLLRVYMYLMRTMNGNIKHVRITPDSYYNILLELGLYEDHIERYKYETPPFDVIRSIPVMIRKDGIDLAECVMEGTLMGKKVMRDKS